MAVSGRGPGLQEVTLEMLVLGSPAMPEQGIRGKAHGIGNLTEQETDREGLQSGASGADLSAAHPIWPPSGK
jgi:hypothetical protein